MYIKIHLIKLNAVVILSLLIIMILHSCIDLSKDRNYTNYLSYFGDSLTSHFPTNTDDFDKYSYSIDTVAYSNTEDFNLTLIGTKKLINKEKLKYNDKKIYNCEDSCIVIVNDFINKSNLLLDLDNEKHKSKLSSNCKKHPIVIPNFWNNILSNGLSKLDKNFKYIIIDSKVGENVYSSKINFYQSYMPSIVRHGYSKGIAFNEKEDVIIYWLVLW